MRNILLLGQKLISDPTFCWSPLTLVFGKSMWTLLLEEIRLFLLLFVELLMAIHFVWSDHAVTDNPLLAEARPCLMACQFAHDIALDQVVFESDSKLIFRAIYDQQPVVGLVADTISWIKWFLELHAEWKVLWASRRQNSMAHLLASWVARCFRFHYLCISLLLPSISLVDSFDPPWTFIYWIKRLLRKKKEW